LEELRYRFLRYCEFNNLKLTRNRIEEQLFPLVIKPDIFSGMLNIKDIRERTRFPSYLDLRRHIYLRFLSFIVPEANDIINAWVDEEAHEFISYPKGEGRKEGVEILAAKGMKVQGIAPIFLGEKRLEEGKVSRLQRLKERLFSKREEE